MFLSPQNSHVEILTPPGHDIRGGSWLNHRVRAFVVALMLLKRDPRDLLWDHTGKEHHLLPPKWALIRHQICLCLSRTPQPPEL